MAFSPDILTSPLIVWYSKGVNKFFLLQLLVSNFYSTEKDVFISLLKLFEKVLQISRSGRRSVFVSTSCLFFTLFI